MAVVHKAATLIRVSGTGNAGHTDFENTMTAFYTIQITGMGPIQNTDGEERDVEFATLTGDTRAGIMVKAKAAVDTAVAAG